MSQPIDLVLFDIGGVLGSNGWDREQRERAIDHFGLDGDDFQYRHEETVGDLESGRITLDEYLEVTVFCANRSFSPERFKAFMLDQSEAWTDSIAIAGEVASAGRARLATLNNEGEELNTFRIRRFGLRAIFPTFFSSCWLGVRKPTHRIYERVLGMTQADPSRTLFIDDRMQNLTPAAALGMQVVHFRDASQLRSDLRSFGLIE
jgi:putative hydrolase of the HAD superfamily